MNMSKVFVVKTIPLRFHHFLKITNTAATIIPNPTR
jgi:hypothetical protein